MTYKEAIRQFGLPARVTQRVALLAALDAEVKKEQNEVGDHELIKCLSAQLFSIGNVEDSLVIWRIKSMNFDLRCGLDVQFLCGAGLDETKAYLENLGTDDAKNALKYLVECIDSGDFENWSVEKWLNFYRFYFHIDSAPPPGL